MTHHCANCDYIIDRLKRENEILRYERDYERTRFESIFKLLNGIYALLYPEPITAADGRKFVFRPKDIDPHEVLQELSNRIRSIPDELAALAKHSQAQNED